MAGKELPTPGSLLDRVVDSVDLTMSEWLIFNYETQLQAIVYRRAAVQMASLEHVVVPRVRTLDLLPPPTSSLPRTIDNAAVGSRKLLRSSSFCKVVMLDYVCGLNGCPAERMATVLPGALFPADRPDQGSCRTQPRNPPILCGSTGILSVVCLGVAGTAVGVTSSADRTGLLRVTYR